MKKIYLSSLLAGVMLSFSACNDFLTELPENAYTLENAVTDYSTAKNSVNGIYGRYAVNSNLGGDLYGKLHDMAGLWNYNQVYIQMTYTQTSGANTGAWNGLYSIINAANAAINGISALDDGKFPSVAEKERLIAEARCWRGYANLQLLWYFGHWFDQADSPYGILYRDKVSDLANLMVGRSTVGESYEYIIDDLKYAEEHLGDYTSPRYLSKQFAQVMHAKLLMNRNWSGDYAEALTLVNAVMSGSPAVFAMEKNITDLYENAWDSNEALFAKYLGDNANATYTDFTYSYALYYNKDFTEIPTDWLNNDERHDYIFGEARAPETWDTATKPDILTKLYHRGRVAGPDDKYTSYVFRYAELYMMKAELLARTNPNDIATPLAELNKMRATYTTPVMTPVTGISTHQELMDAIFKEYVVTLFMENETPWFASLRFEHNGSPWINTLKPDMQISKNKYCWPIPDDEIIAHLNPIEQNPDLK